MLLLIIYSEFILPTYCALSTQKISYKVHRFLLLGKNLWLSNLKSTQ